ncbi:hypothetical protein BH23ACT2_BH23ACT2_02670 [soil metagenome]
MRFEVTQRYRSPVAEVVAAYADPGLYPALVGLPKLGDIEVLDHREEGDTATLRVRFRFTGHLPSAVTAVVDPERLTWVQESTHNLTDGTTTFRLLPDHYPDRLRASGTCRVDGEGDGARRVVAGELEVRGVPLVGGRVERAIVGGLEEYLAAEAPAVDAYLNS